MRNNIRLDIDELIAILNQIKNDGLNTVELEIHSSEFFDGAGEIDISALETYEDENTPYGSLAGIAYTDDEIC